MAKSKLNDSIEYEKLLILTKFLENAPFERWSNHNLKSSAAECGFSSGYVSLLFNKGIDDLTGYFYQILNRSLAESFLKKNMYTKIVDKISYLIELKLDLYDSHRRAIPLLVQYNIAPQNLRQTQSFLWQTCDQIWFLAGDKSTDYNYYTKRTLLGYVYTSSVMYWLSDESANYAETKKFIRCKLQEVLKLGQWKDSVMRFFEKLAE